MLDLPTCKCHVGSDCPGVAAGENIGEGVDCGPQPRHSLESSSATRQGLWGHLPEHGLHSGTGHGTRREGRDRACRRTDRGKGPGGPTATRMAPAAPNQLDPMWGMKKLP